MKVSLLRNTMIAGTPTSAGSIIDVEDHVGELLINLHKAEILLTPKPKSPDKPNFDRMTKLELDTFGNEKGLELDLSKTKKQLIAEIQTALSIT